MLLTTICILPASAIPEKRRSAGRHITKLLRVMHLTAAFLLLFSLSISARTVSQTVTFSGKNVTLDKVFDAIEKQTGFHVLSTRGQVNPSETVSVHAENMELSAFLQKVLSGKPYSFEISSKTIFIKKAIGTGQPKKIMVKDPPVKGEVRDVEGHPLAAVNIVVKETGKGTVTDANGRFTIDASPGQTLEISSIGYEKVTRQLDLNEFYPITLQVATSKLDEVQVIAYGQTTQRYNTGNVSTIKADEISRQPVNNPLLALQGNVPGLFINQASGMPGAEVNVQIQGTNSMQSGNDPFYVIDGVPYVSYTGFEGTGPIAFGNPLSFINPMDIESISVLKDADATAIYGTRAANGAILITTKKGKAGKPRVDFNLQQGWSRVSRTLDLMDNRQYIALRRDAILKDSLSIGAGDWDINGTWDTTRNADWQKELIGKTARYSLASASISGGSDWVQYLFGATYRRETTVFPGDFADRKGSIHFNVTSVSANKKFRALFTGNYMLDDNRLPGDDLTAQAVSLPPTAPQLLNADGSINWAIDSFGASKFPFNPIAKTFNHYKNATTNLVANANLSYELIRGLTLSSNFGYTNLRSDETRSLPLIAVNPNDRPFNQRVAVFSYGKNYSWTIEPQLHYQLELGRGTLEALAGSTFQERTIDAKSYLALGFATDLLLEDIRSATNLFANYSRFEEYKYNSLFGRLNYNYADRYVLNVTARRDGSSRFGAKNRFANFGAVGAAWIFTQEKWMQAMSPFLSFGKLRASYGTTGNDQLGEYAYLDYYQPVTADIPYQGANGFEPFKIANPYLKWEQTTKLNIGMELGLLKDRVYANANYFRNRTTDQVIYTDLPYTAGFPFFLQNFPATVQNAGWEISVTSKNIQGKDFTWSTAVNVTIPRNKLLKYDNLDKSSDAARLVIGQPIDVDKVYHFLGVDPQEGIYLVADAEGKPTQSPDPAKDRTVLLTEFPRHYGGISNTIRYKKFQLDMLLQFVFRNTRNNVFGDQPGRYLRNQLAELNNRWMQPGDNAVFQRATTKSLYRKYLDYANGSDAAYMHADYARLKNASLSWEMPDRWLKAIHSASARVFVQGQNLLTITNFKMLDPETIGGKLPPLKIWTMGVQASL